MFLQHAEFYGLDSIEVFEADCYWYVGEETRYDLSKDPSIAVGSLLEDLQAAAELASNNERLVTLVDLRHIAGLLEYISYQLFTLRPES